MGPEQVWQSYKDAKDRKVGKTQNADDLEVFAEVFCLIGCQYTGLGECIPHTGLADLDSAAYEMCHTMCEAFDPGEAEGGKCREKTVNEVPKIWVDISTDVSECLEKCQTDTAAMDEAE